MAIVNGYTTLAEVRTRLRVTAIEDTSDDATLEQIVAAVSRQIDRYTGRRFYPTTETRYFSVPTGRQLILSDDLLVVTAITNGDGTTVPPSAYNLEPLNHTPKYAVVLKQAAEVVWRGDAEGNTEGVISVAGSWGFAAETPADIREACLLQSARLFKRQDAPFGVAGTNAVGEAVLISKFDPDVEALLKPYRRIV
jgi:hypothetical protein